MAIIRKKIQWVLMGLFAPELVLYVAWKHWRSAKELTERVNDSFEKQVSSSSIIGSRFWPTPFEDPVILTFGAPTLWKLF
jgi:hypothetical protein